MKKLEIQKILEKHDIQKILEKTRNTENTGHKDEIKVILVCCKSQNKKCYRSNVIASHRFISKEKRIVKNKFENVQSTDKEVEKYFSNAWKRSLCHYFIKYLWHSWFNKGYLSYWKRIFW